MNDTVLVVVRECLHTDCRPLIRCTCCRRSLSGVWRITLCTPESFTPVRFNEIPPAADASRRCLRWMFFP